MSNTLPYDGGFLRTQTGVFTIPAETAGGLTAHNVTFPSSFAVVPKVALNPEVADPAVYMVCAVLRTKEGFQIKVRRVGAASNQSFPVTWIATV